MAEQKVKKLRLFNTLSGQLEPFIPLDPQGKQVKMYVCGPTVYDDAHLGHARCYITWDVLYRFLKFLGYNVTYVRNVTDVDDKILNRAMERGEAPRVLAERNYGSFSEDMKALNVLPPDVEPRATQYIAQMLDGIKTLIGKGAAYTTADGSAYFRVAAKPDYGKLKFGTHNAQLLKKHLDDLKAGARVEVDEGKESPLDFALWKAVPLSDPHGWESPWPAADTLKGWGRPGWHMECSAMNHAVFGEQIDIHAGGADLIFPHHENEIAQSEAWSGKQPFAGFWLHNGFVNVSGEKMSKSLGNFSTIKKLLLRYDANTIRYFLLTNHYRMPVDFNEEALQAAENWTKRIYRLLTSVFHTLGVQHADLVKWIVTDIQYIDHKHLAINQETDTASIFGLFEEAMLDDLNSPRALGVLNAVLGNLQLSFNADAHAPEAQVCFSETISIMTHLGFDLSLLFETGSAIPADKIQMIYQEITQKASEQEPGVLLEELVMLRKQAKAAKNWAQADAIRNQLIEIGLQILDNKDGTSTVEKDGLEIVRV